MDEYHQQSQRYHDFQEVIKFDSSIQDNLYHQASQ